MFIAPLLLSCLALAGAQRILRSDVVDSWSSSYPDITNPRISERIFRDNKEYRYLYDGQILTGLPEAADQFSGLRIRCVFSIQLRSGVDVMKIEKATLGRVNERYIVGPMKLKPVSYFEELQGEEAREWEMALTKPIRFEYNDGAVTNMESMESDPFWSVNIKRSILSAFNLDLKKKTGASQFRNQNRFLNRMARSDNMENTEYYSVMEEGIGGECEAIYVIQSVPSGFGSHAQNTGYTQGTLNGLSFLNVTKTWDYDNCKNRPISMESLNNPIKCESQGNDFSSNCKTTNTGTNDNDSDDIIDSASHTRYNIVGTRNEYIIEHIMTEAVHKFTPYSENAGSITAYVNATMKLIYSGDWVRDSLYSNEVAGNSLKGLRQMFTKYTGVQNGRHSWEAKEANKQFTETTGYWPNVATKKVLIKSLLNRLVEDLADNDVEPESANLVLQMSVILQYATTEELIEIHREIKTLAHQSFEQEQIEKLWMDILALSGTKPAVLFVKNEIMNGKLVGERAAQILNSLAFTINKPDHDIVREFLDMCKHPSVSGHANMKKACWLSFGTLAHTSCVDDLETTVSVQNTVVSIGNPYCTREARRQFVVELLARMRTFQNEEDQILMLKTIGNTGFKEAVDDLKAIFSDDSRTVLIRTTAIYAMSHICRSHSELALSVLVPEFYDITNHYQVRIAAFDMMIECRPELAELEMAARSLHDEKSTQVGSYVYSKLNSIANSTHPCFENLAKDASLALEFAKPFYTGLSFSKSFHYGMYLDQLQMGGFAEINTIADPSSVIPRGVNFRLNTHMFGLSHEIIDAGIESEGLNAIFKNIAMSRDEDFLNTASVFDWLNNEYSAEEQTSANRGSRKAWNRPEFDEIDTLLGITDKVNEKVKGSAYLKIFGQEVRFLSFTPQSFIKLATDAYLKPSEMAGLKFGMLPVDHRRAFMAADGEITIPTELGLPLTVELKAPVVVSVKGTVGLKTQPALSLATLVNLPHSVSVESDIKVSVATEIHGKMSVWAVFYKIGAGVRAQISTTFPVNGDISLDLKTGKVSTSIDLPNEPFELLNLEVMPVTYTKWIPKSLAPHQPDIKDARESNSAEKVVQYNRQPMSNEQPLSTQYWSFRTDFMENPFMLTRTGRADTQFYQGLSIPVLEVKEISTFDTLKSKLIQTQFGHPALGVIVDVKGECTMAYGVPNAIGLPIGGKNRMVVTVKPISSGLKTIDVTLHMRQQHFAGASVPTWTKLYDELNNYNSASLLERLTDSLPVNFAKNDKTGFSTQLVIRGNTGSSQEVAMQGVFSWIRGMDGKFVKCAAEFTSPHPQFAYQACFNGHAEYPSEYESWNLTPGFNKPITGRFELSMGRSCNAADATKIKVTFAGDKSPEQLSLEKNDYYTINGQIIPEVLTKTVEPMAYVMAPLYQQCENDRKRGIRFSSACETVKEIFSTMMQLKIDIDYQNIPFALEKIMSKAEKMAHGLWFWNSQIDDVRVKNTPNHMTILADFTGADERVDIVYSTPEKDCKMLNMPIPYPFAPLSADDEPMNIWETLLNEDLDDTCSVSGNQLNTLDSAEMKIPFSECYQLLAKDCSSEELWSVLFASAGSRNSDAKKVLVYIGNNKIELLPAESVTGRFRAYGDLMVKVNGRVVSAATANGAISIDEDIEIELQSESGSTTPYFVLSAEEYGLELWFDGHNVALKPTFWLRNQVCGLCGNNNGDEWDDMLLPNGKFANSVEDLVRGYTVRKDNCATEFKMLNKLQTSSLFPQSVSECGKMKTVVKTRPGRVCFSVQPVASCPSECAGAMEQEYEEEYTMVKRVGFHCLPEDSTLAQRLLGEVQTRVLTEIAMKPANDYFVVSMGGSCGNDATGRRVTGMSSFNTWNNRY